MKYVKYGDILHIFISSSRAKICNRYFSIWNKISFHLRSLDQVYFIIWPLKYTFLERFSLQYDYFAIRMVSNKKWKQWVRLICTKFHSTAMITLMGKHLLHFEMFPIILYNCMSHFTCTLNAIIRACTAEDNKKKRAVSLVFARLNKRTEQIPCISSANWWEKTSVQCFQRKQTHCLFVNIDMIKIECMYDSIYIYVMTSHGLDRINEHFQASTLSNELVYSRFRSAHHTSEIAKLKRASWRFEWGKWIRIKIKTKHEALNAVLYLFYLLCALSLSHTQHHVTHTRLLYL